MTNDTLTTDAGTFHRGFVGQLIDGGAGAYFDDEATARALADPYYEAWIPDAAIITR